MTTVSQVIDAIQQINGGVKGVKFAPSSAQYPDQLTPDKLPAAITFLGEDDWLKASNTQFEIDVYVAPVGSTNPRQAMQQCLALVQAFGDTWRALHKVDTFPIIRQPRNFGTTGVHRTIAYAGAEYFGFCVRIPLMGIS